MPSFTAHLVPALPAVCCWPLGDSFATAFSHSSQILEENVVFSSLAFFLGMDEVCCHVLEVGVA